MRNKESGVTLGGEQMNLFLFVIVILLIVFIYMRESQMQEERKDFQEERKDLMDRIMSKDYVEYKEQTTEPISYTPVTMTEEAEYWREIEENKV
jgi:predicted Holliday junction resolvase-like endonuclease